MRKEIAIFIIRKDVPDDFKSLTEEEKEELLNLCRSGLFINRDDEEYHIELIHTIV